MTSLTRAAHRRILIVDPSPAVHQQIRLSLQSLGQPAEHAAADAIVPRPAARGQSFQSDAAGSGAEAIQRVLENADQPYALAIVNQQQPGGWDGVETVQYLWEIDPRLEIVLITRSAQAPKTEILSRLGHSDRLLLLHQPVDPEEMRLVILALTEKWQLRRQAETRQDELTRVLRARAIEILATQDVTVFALAKLAESRDPETGEHLERIRSYAQVLGEQLADDGPYKHLIDQRFLEDLYRSTPLHDIGKVGIPDAVLLKPGPLSKEEFEIMKQHVRIGADALRTAASHSIGGGFLKMAVEIAAYHHERFDGSGYLQGLRGTDIPLCARIVALADVFDALTSQRVYKEAFPPQDARKLIEEEKGRHFDPAVVSAFRKRYRDFVQVGGLVRGRRAKKSVPASARLYDVPRA